MLLEEKKKTVGGCRTSPGFPFDIYRHGLCIVMKSSPKYDQCVLLFQSASLHTSGAAGVNREQHCRPFKCLFVLCPLWMSLCSLGCGCLHACTYAYNAGLVGGSRIYFSCALCVSVARQHCACVCVCVCPTDCMLPTTEGRTACSKAVFFSHQCIKYSFIPYSVPLISLWHRPT